MLIRIFILFIFSLPIHADEAYDVCERTVKYAYGAVEIRDAQLIRHKIQLCAHARRTRTIVNSGFRGNPNILQDKPPVDIDYERWHQEDELNLVGSK